MKNGLHSGGGSGLSARELHVSCTWRDASFSAFLSAASSFQLTEKKGYRMKPTAQLPPHRPQGLHPPPRAARPTPPAPPGIPSQHSASTESCSSTWYRTRFVPNIPSLAYLASARSAQVVERVASYLRRLTWADVVSLSGNCPHIRRLRLRTR